MWVLRKPVARLTVERIEAVRCSDAQDTWSPAGIAELKEAGGMLSAGRAQFALRILDGCLGCGGSLHVLSLERARKVAPESAALVRFLCVFRRDPLGRDGAAVFLHVE